MVSTVSRMFLYYATTRPTKRRRQSVSLSLFHSLSLHLFRSSTLNTRSSSTAVLSPCTYTHHYSRNQVFIRTRIVRPRPIFRHRLPWPASRRSRVSRSYKRYTTHIRTRRSLISTRSVRARAHFFFNLCFDTVVSRVSPPFSTARQMYTLARRVPIVPLFNSFPFNS